MRLGVVVWMGCAMMLATGTVAGARGERELSDDELRGEMAINRALAAYVVRNGEPDLAETHFLADRGPWDDHEVTLYYLDSRKEIGFARAWILGRPEIQISRYERPLTDEQVAVLGSRAHSLAAPAGRHHMAMAVGHPMGPAERAEHAAGRAEEAASRVEAAATAAERAAERTEAIVARMETMSASASRKK